MKYFYSLNIGDKDEKEEIRNIIELAKKRIPKVHDIIKKRNYILPHIYISGYSPT